MSTSLFPGCGRDLPQDLPTESEYARVAADAARTLRLHALRQTATIRQDREISSTEIEAAIDATSGPVAIAAEAATLFVANCQTRERAHACIDICRALVDLHHWPACGAEPEIERLRR